MKKFEPRPVDYLFPKAAESKKLGNCVFCNKEIKEGEFTDDRSSREYAISGLCQQCQDKVFSKT